MSKEAITFYAKKFFPHLLQTHGEKLVVELLKLHGILK